MAIKIPIQTDLRYPFPHLVASVQKAQKGLPQVQALFNRGYSWEQNAKNIQKALSLEDRPCLNENSDRTILSKLLNRPVAHKLIKEIKKTKSKAAAEILCSVMKTPAQILIEFSSGLLKLASELGITTGQGNQFGIRRDEHELLYKQVGDSKFYHIEHTGRNEGLEVKHKQNPETNELTVRRFSSQTDLGDIIYKEDAKGAKIGLRKSQQERWLEAIESKTTTKQNDRQETTG